MMFALEIKKHVNDMNARAGSANPTSHGHQRQSSQPAGSSAGGKNATGKLVSNMPLSGKTTGGLAGENAAMGRTQNGPDINDLMARQAQPRGQTAATGNRGAGGKINLEAYEAYNNSKENALLLSQTRSEELGNAQANNS